MLLFPEMLRKSLQRQEGGGPSASSQERRAPVVPLINQLSTGYRVCRLGLHGCCFVHASEELRKTAVFVVLGFEMTSRPLAEQLRAALPHSPPARPASPRLASPHPARPGPAVPCPARRMSGFRNRQIVFASMRNDEDAAKHCFSMRITALHLSVHDMTSCDV